MNLEQTRKRLSRFFRTGRMNEFANEFKVAPATRVLDVGGTPFNWRLLRQLPDVTLLNIPDQQAGRDPEGMKRVLGDGCDMPFENGAFPIVFSNSTIEHLGTWWAPGNGNVRSPMRSDASGRATTFRRRTVGSSSSPTI